MASSCLAVVVFSVVLMAFLSLQSVTIAEGYRKLKIRKMPSRALFNDVVQSHDTFRNPNLNQQDGISNPNLNQQHGINPSINPNPYNYAPSFYYDRTFNPYNFGDKSTSFPSSFDDMSRPSFPKYDSYAKTIGHASTNDDMSRPSFPKYDSYAKTTGHASTNDYKVDKASGVPAFPNKLPSSQASSLDETSLYGKHQSSSSSQQGFYHTPFYKKGFYSTPTYEERFDDATSNKQISIPNIYYGNHPSHTYSIHTSPFKGSSVNDELQSSQLVSNYDTLFNNPSITHGSSILHASITPSFAHPSQNHLDHDIKYGQVQVP